MGLSPSESGKSFFGPLAAVAAGIILCLAGCNGVTATGRNSEGVRMFQQGRYQDALREFQEASYADASNPDSYYNLAATYHRTGRLYNRPADLKQAEDLYNQCLDRKPDHRDCYRGLAVLLAEQGRSDEAFRLLQGWVDRQPGSADAKIELARLFDEMGERNAAKAHLLEALAIDPDNTRALVAIGRVRESLGEHGPALAAYQRAWAQDNRQPELAARIASLQAATIPPSGGYPAPNGDTTIRWVNGPNATRR
ncbi:MAG: tetratricopeptide repeat protein [Planctomycetota bacterium]